MAEEIAIIIKAVDEVSVKLDKIQKTISGFSKQSVKQTEAVSNSFEKNITTLLALGNAANTVDNIFSSLTNLQLRLENATERVANAQDRLTDAYRKLHDVQTQGNNDAVILERSQLNLEKATSRLRVAIMKYGENSIEAREATIDLKDAQFDLSEAHKLGKKRADEVTRAQEDIERATRGLTIAENNLARTQNMVIGTYINVGLQVLTLTQSMRTMIKTIDLAAISARGLQLSMVPLGIALLAVGTILGVTLLSSTKDMTGATNDLNSSVMGFGNSVSDATTSLYNLNSAEKVIDDGTTQTISIFTEREEAVDGYVIKIREVNMELKEMLSLEGQTQFKRSTGRGPPGAGFGTLQNTGNIPSDSLLMQSIRNKISTGTG